MKCLDDYRMRLMFDSFIMAIVLVCIGPANGATITVGPGAGYDFNTVQAGIDAANNADTVLVAPGEYVITGPITFRGKAITVKSEVGPDETTIRMGTPADPQRAGVVVFENGETIASVLDGFTITGGRGIFSPTENAWLGGGIGFNASSGTVRNCAIVENQTTGSGGGVVLVWGASATLTNCIIRRNSATEFAGGVSSAYDSSLTMTECTITENSAGNCSGGVSCGYSSSGILTDCIIIANSAENSGGGIFCWDSSSMTLTNCTIAGNSVERYGGGLCNGADSSTTVINCTLWGNSAGISGGGLGCWASATVTSSILWGNMAPEGPEMSAVSLESWWCGMGSLAIMYSDVAGGQTNVSVESGGTLNWGDGNIDVDPCFTDPNNHDFHVKSEAGRWDPNSESWVQDDVTSPCIDAGDPMSPVMYEPHPRGCIINIGAYGGTEEASKSSFGCSYEVDAE